MPHLKVSAQLSSRYFYAGQHVRAQMNVVKQSSQPGITNELSESISFLFRIQAFFTAHALKCPPLDSKLGKSLGLVESPRDPFAIKDTTGNLSRCIYRSATHQVTVKKNGECTTFSIPLAADCCPSFQTRYARVLYVMSGVAQGRLQDKDSAYQIPFEVYSTCQYNFDFLLLPPVAIDPKVKCLSDSNADQLHVAVSKSMEIPFELTANLLHGRNEADLMQHPQTSVYSITREDQHLLQFMLTKQLYHLGDSILGIFDFTNATIPCYRVSAKLLCQEVRVQTDLPEGILDKNFHSNIVSTHEECSKSTIQTYCELVIPPNSVPTICTNYVRVHWIIAFEFVTDDKSSRDGTQQLLRWQIPITVTAKPLSHEILADTNVLSIPKRFFIGHKQQKILV